MKQPFPRLDPQPKCVVGFSGGIQSYIAAKRMIAKYGPAAVLLLFCDTKMEDPDCYRFLHDASATLHARLITIADGRTPWQVFADERLLGNWWHDPCSKILKRTLARQWMTQSCPDPSTTMVLGMDWTEQHRHGPARRSWSPYNVAFPLMYKPLLMKEEMLAECLADGLRPQRMYALGFSHSNCGGFCVKAGLRHYRHLLATWPEVYDYHAKQEQKLTQELGRRVTFLSKQDNRITLRFTLAEFRDLVTNGCQTDDDEVTGGCGCFA